MPVQIQQYSTSSVHAINVWDFDARSSERRFHLIASCGSSILSIVDMSLAKDVISS